MSERTLVVGTFTRSLVLEVARTTGRLDDLGWLVREESVISSPAQFSALDAGNLDLAFTSPDNALLYTGFTDNPLGARLPLVITAALDRGLGLSLWARPGISLPQARTLAVDVPVSGFALAAFALLELRGCPPGSLEVVCLGATPRRRDALIAGRCDVTILGAGNELQAEAAGCMRLASVGALGPYLGAVACRLPTLAPERAAAADRLVSALVDTAAEICAGAYDAPALTAAGRVLGLDEALARRHLAVLRSAAEGLSPDGRLHRTDLDTLVSLRERAGQDAAALERAADLLITTASGRAS